MSTKKSDMFAKLAAQQQVGSPNTPTDRVAPNAVDTPPTTTTPPQTNTPPPRYKGKRDHPDYVQANAYLPKKLRRAVEKALIDIEDMDYSTLVEDLLRQWLKARGVSE